MKLYLISNNTDTAVGLRLAGVEGTVVQNENEVADVLSKTAEDENIALILINKSLFNMCDSAIRDFRKSHSAPVIIEIPDRDSSSSGDSLAKYIRETVGINI